MNKYYIILADNKIKFTELIEADSKTEANSIGYYEAECRDLCFLGLTDKPIEFDDYLEDFEYMSYSDADNGL